MLPPAGLSTVTLAASVLGPPLFLRVCDLQPRHSPAGWPLELAFKRLQAGLLGQIRGALSFHTATR